MKEVVMKLLNRDSWVWLAAFLGTLLAFIDGTPPFSEWARHDWIQLGLLVVAWATGKAATSPFPGEVKRSNTPTVVPLLVALLVLPFASACNKHLTFQTNPVGTTAHYATQVTQAAKGVQDLVIGFESGGQIPTTTARSVVVITVEIGRKAQELAVALSELDRVGLTDMSRRPLVAKIGLILQTVNELTDKLKLGDYFITLAPDVRDRVHALLKEIGSVLITVGTEIR